MAYFNEDDDKKKSSSSSSSGSSKGSSSKSSSSGGSSKSSSGFSDPVWSYQAQRRTDSVKPNESLLDTKQAALRAVNKRNNDLLANGATLDTGLGPLYRRGDRNYNRAQQSYYNKRRNQTQQQQQPTSPLQPQNATQGLAQSNATQYGIRGISGLNNTTPDLMSDGKWYAGEAPTDIEAAARIQLRGLGDDTMDELLASRRDKGSSFYRAYSGITSEAVGQLAALGVEIPAGGLTDEWFQKNQWLMQYYKPSKNSTTGNPTYPKHGTLEQKAAFWYYQAQQDRDDTNKAETELAALKEELAFYAGSNGNYSDEEIAGKVDWKKYPTLVKMGSIKGSEDGTPLQFVRRIDFDQDYLQGMIWAARNGGGTGDAFSDSVYALLGEGAGYEDNPEIRAKRTWTRDNEDYSPYSLGPSSAKMNEAGMYFGTYSFDKEWLDQNAERYVNSLNPKDQEMINRVLEADKFTSDCEAELDKLLNGTIGEDGTRVGGLDSAVTDFTYVDKSSFEENVDALLEEVYGDRKYKNLEKLDESMAEGPLGLRDTTRAIDYRKQDIRALLAEKLQAKQTAPTVKGAGDETETWFERAWRGLQSAFTPEPTPDPSDLVQIKGEAGNAVEDTRQKTAASVGKTVNDIGTPSEKNQWRTGEIGQQETSDKIGGNIKKGIPTGTGGQVMLDLIDGSVDGTEYINNRNTVLQYEDNNERLKGIHEERDQILNRRNERKGGYINRNDEIAANFGQNSTKSASLFGWVFGNKEQPAEEDEEEVEAVEQEYRPAVADMTLDQKTAWIQRKINNVNTTDEEAAGLRDLLAQYRASANWDDNDEAVPMQRQMLDDALAQYIGEPAYAPQNTGIDPEIARLQQEAMDAVSKLNPDVETFEEAQAWVAEQEGDSEDLADAKDAVRLVELAGEERVLNVRQEEMQADYDKAFDMIKGLRNRYAEDQTVWTVTGSGGETNLIAADVLDFVSQFGDYVPYQYSDTNYYDYLIKDKGYSDEQAREEAVKNNDSYRELKGYIQTALDACDEKGVSIPADYRQHMEQEMTRLDKLIADGTYYALRGNDDFVSVTDAAAKPKSDDEPGFVSPQSRPAGFSDMEWNIVSTPGTDVAPAVVRNMTEDEQRTFLYLANSYEDKRLGAKAAQKYYEHLTDEYGAVTTRRGREMTEAMYNDFRNLDAVTFNVGGTLATIAMHPFQAMSGFYTFGMAMMGKTANPDSVWGALGKASNRERETIRGIAVDTIGSMWGETAGNLAGDGYDLVTGVFDNLWDAAVMGATGFSGPLGEAGEAASFSKKVVYNIVNGTVTAMPLGLSAAGMEYIDAIGRGLSPDQAYLLAGISGLAEAVTEGLEIESFTEAYGKAGKEGFKGLLQNIALSMTNESVGEALGQYTENLADDVISGHLSNRNQLFEQYVAAGYGKEEAHKLADHAMTMDIVKAAIMGGLSGGLSTALTGSAGAFHYESDYSTFRKTNADYLTNIVHGFQDIGFSPTAAQQMADRYAREAYEAHAEDIANTANNMDELRAERRSVNLTAIEAENAANENAQRLQEADMAADEFAEEQGEPFTPYTPAERPVNPRMEEVNNFEITPLTQFNELTDELAKIDGTETFSGEVKSEAVETLYSAVGYTDMAQEAAANGDTQTADDYLRKGMAAFNALDAILDRAGIDKGRFPFLTDTEAMAQVREYMNRQGPEQQFKQTGGEQTTLIPGESETAPIVDNEGLTAEDARAEKVDTRPVEMQGGQVTNITGESETSPDINTVEAMETVNRGPEPLRPIQGPKIRKNPFSAEFKRELASRDQMKGQVLTLSGKQATPANGATMLAGVFDSVVAMKDSITDGQAMAAAKRLLGKAKDVDSVIGAVRSILVTAADQSINNTDTVTAIQTAALTDGEAGRILDNIINIGTATPNRVRNLVATAMREAGTLANEMWANTYDGMVAEIVHRMAGEGALTRTSKAQAVERARYSQLKEAQKTTETQEEVIAALQQKLTNAYEPFSNAPLDKIAEAAYNSAQKQLDAAFSVLMSYRKSEINAQNAHKQAEQNYFDTRNEEMTQVREAARQEADQRIAEARAQRQEREAQRQARGNAIVGKKGTAYLNSTTPIDYHYELVDDNALIASNDVNGVVNPEYPSYLQPRDRTRAVSQYEVQDRAVHLNPEMLGANPDIAQGAPVIGPDYAVESGNGRMMAIRLARQGNLPGAVRYTEMLRNRAAEFGFRPEQVGPNSVLVRVRDTPVNRADFTRAANVQATASMSSSEQAKIDAERITPEMLAKYNMETDTANDAFKGKQNQDFLDAFLKTIPLAEMGKTRDSKGMISEDGKDRVRNALIQFAYDSDILTKALTETKNESALNLKRVLSNIAPVISNYRADISEGRFEDIGLLDTLSEAVENYIDLKARGENVYEYINNYVMDGFEEISNAAKEMMVMFEQNVRTAKKIGRYMTDLIRNVTKPQDSDQTSMLDFGEIPTDLASTIRGSFDQTAQAIENESNGVAQGQVSLDSQDVYADAISADNVVPETGPLNRQAPNNKPIKSGAQIINELENALGIVIDDRKSKYLRGKRKNSSGYTINGTMVTHIQDADNVKTAAHEIGHKFDEVFDLSNSPAANEMVRELETNPEYGRQAWIASYPENQRKREAVAEFSRFWIMDRSLAEKFGGEEFLKTWEDDLASRGWLAPMKQAAQDLMLNMAATNGERAKASVVMETKEVRDKYEKGLLGLATEFADYTMPLEDIEFARKKQEGARSYRASLDPRTLMLARNGGSVTNFVDSCINDTMVNPEGDIVLKDDGTPWGSLKDITGDIPIQRAHDLATIWQLQNAQDRSKVGKNIFASDIDVDAALKELADANPDLVKVAERLHDWFNKFVETWVIDRNGLGPNSRKLWDAMKKMYPHYAPAFPVTTAQKRLVNSKGYLSPKSGMGRAFGNTAPVLDPVLGCVEYMQRYISNYRQGEVLRGIVASKDVGNILMEPAQFDLKAQKENTQNEIVSNRVLKALAELKENQDVTDAAIEKLKDVIDNLPELSFMAKRKDESDVINVPMEDGSISSWTVYQPEIIRTLMVAPPNQRSRFIRAVGNAAKALVGFLSGNATSRSLGFSLKNAESDTDTAIATGHAGRISPTYYAQWLKAGAFQLKNTIREKRGKEVDEAYRLFKLFGKYGSRFSIRTKEDQLTMRQNLYDAKPSVKDRVITVTDTFLTSASGFLEDTTRLNEFLHSYEELRKAGLSEYDARLIAGKDSHEVTTDFKKYGAAVNEINAAKAIIPFFNGQLQGVYKTLRMFSKENEGHRADMVARLTFHCMVGSIVQSILRNLSFSDDEKDYYNSLSEYERNKYYHFKLGNMFLRVKKSQDGILQMAEDIGNVIGNNLTGNEGDTLGDLYGLGKAVVENMVLNFDTVFDPFIDALHGVTWSGRQIVDYDLDGMSTINQYDANTPKIARQLSSFVKVFGVDIAPQAWGYIGQQYTGAWGSLGSDFFELISNGDLNAQNALFVLRNHFASALAVDPAYSNTLATTAKNSKTNLKQAIEDAKHGREVSCFRNDLTQGQVNKAIEEAQKMMGSKGSIKKLDKDIAVLWSKHDKILKDSKMTKAERANEARRVREQINDLYLQQNGIMGDFWAKYGWQNQTIGNICNFLHTINDNLFKKNVPKIKEKN